MKIPDKNVKKFNFSDKYTLKQRNMVFFFTQGQFLFIGLFLYNDWLLSCQWARAQSLLNQWKTVMIQIQQRPGRSPASSHPSALPPALVSAGRPWKIVPTFVGSTVLSCVCDQQVKEENMARASSIANCPVPMVAVG